MELQNQNNFQMTPKARNLAFGLIGLGSILAIVGVIMSSGDDHFLTRLMTNGLINGFFFFAIGLGALFFLALNYAVRPAGMWLLKGLLNQ